MKWSIRMKEIEQIKMRKDIDILTDKYRISVSGLAREFELPERTLREFIFAPQRNLSDENFVKTKDGDQETISPTDESVVPRSLVKGVPLGTELQKTIKEYNISRGKK